MYSLPILRTVSLVGLSLLSLALASCGKTPPAPVVMAAPIAANTGSLALTARLSGTEEVPPVTGSGAGRVEASLNSQSRLLTWTATYSGLTGAASAAHFHGPAAIGENAGVAVPISGSLASPITGTATLTDAQMADLMAGKWYLNLHTAAHPNGEIRGQLSAQR